MTIGLIWVQKTTPIPFSVTNVVAEAATVAKENSGSGSPSCCPPPETGSGASQRRAMTYARCMAAVEVSVVLLGPENQRWRPMYPAQAIGHPGWHAEEAVQPELLVTIKS